MVKAFSVRRKLAVACLLIGGLAGGWWLLNGLIFRWSRIPRYPRRYDARMKGHVAVFRNDGETIRVLKATSDGRMTSATYDLKGTLIGEKSRAVDRMSVIAIIEYLEAQHNRVGDDTVTHGWYPATKSPYLGLGKVCYEGRITDIMWEGQMYYDMASVPKSIRSIEEALERLWAGGQ